MKVVFGNVVMDGNIGTFGRFGVISRFWKKKISRKFANEPSAAYKNDKKYDYPHYAKIA